MSQKEWGPQQQLNYSAIRDEFDGGREGEPLEEEN
jgi:hypothetical protein